MQLLNFMGQPQIVNDIAYHIRASVRSNQPFEHTVLYGPPGLGKTTLVNMIASDAYADLIQKTGQEINRADLWQILTEIKRKTFFFIDEIHAAPLKAMEILYGPMQIINDLKIKQIKTDFFNFEGHMLRPFTLIGATTSSGTIAKPLRDRFILAYNFKYYSSADLLQILMYYGCSIAGAQCISKRSRGTPRIAVNFLIRLDNEHCTRNLKEDQCLSMFERLGIDEIGLTETDREILRYLTEKGCSSESELSKTLGIDHKDYANIYEMYLLYLRFIKITPKGRMITPKGEKYINDYSS